MFLLAATNMLSLSTPGGCSVLEDEEAVQDETTSVSRVTSRGNETLTLAEYRPTSDDSPFDQFPNPEVHNPESLLAQYPENSFIQPSSVRSYDFYEFVNDFFDKTAITGKRMRRSANVRNTTSLADETLSLSSESSNTEAKWTNNIEDDADSKNSSSLNFARPPFFNNLPSDVFLLNSKTNILTNNFKTNFSNVNRTNADLTNTSKTQNVSQIQVTEKELRNDYDTTSSPLPIYDSNGEFSLNYDDNVQAYDERSDGDIEDIIIINAGVAEGLEPSEGGPIVDVVEYDQYPDSREADILLANTQSYETSDDDSLQDFAYGVKKHKDIILHDIDYVDEQSNDSQIFSQEILDKNDTNFNISHDMNDNIHITNNRNIDIHDRMMGDQPKHVEPGSVIGKLEKKNLWNLGWLFESEVEREKVTTPEPRTTFQRNNIMQNDWVSLQSSARSRASPHDSAMHNDVIGPSRKGGIKSPVSSSNPVIQQSTRKGGRKHAIQGNNAAIAINIPDDEVNFQSERSTRKGGRKTSNNFQSEGQLNEHGKYSPLQSPDFDTSEQSSHDKVKRESNSAIDVFPHLFKIDLGNHDDYYYDEQDDIFSEINALWKDSKEEIVDTNPRNNGESSSTRRQFFLPSAHPKEARRVATASAQLPDDMQVMALTRENFHVIAPIEPKLINISSINILADDSPSRKSVPSRVRKDAHRVFDPRYNSDIEIVPYEAMERHTNQPIRKKGGLSHFSSGASKRLTNQEPISTDIPVPAFDAINSKVQYSYNSDTQPVWGLAVSGEANDVLPLTQQLEASQPSYSVQHRNEAASEHKLSSSYPINRGTWSWGPSNRRRPSSLSKAKQISTSTVVTENIKIITNNPEVITQTISPHLNSSSEYRKVKSDIIPVVNSPAIAKQIGSSYNSHVNNGESNRNSRPSQEILRVTDSPLPHILSNIEKRENVVSSASRPLDIAQLLIPDSHAHITESKSIQSAPTTVFPFRNRHSKRVTVNVTIATQDDNKGGNGPTGEDKPVYVLSVSVPASDFGEGANINIIQPQTQSEYDGEKINLSSKMMNDVQIPSTRNNNFAPSVNISLSKLNNVYENRNEDIEKKDCDCPCDCSKIDKQDQRNAINMFVTEDNRLHSNKNVSTVSTSVDNSTGCTIIVQSSATTPTTTPVTSTTPESTTTPDSTTTTPDSTTTTPATTTTPVTTITPPSLSPDILHHIKGETRFFIIIPTK